MVAITLTPSDILAENYEFLESLARQAARSVGRKFRTPFEDMAQEALMWCLTHPEKFIEYWEQGNTGRLVAAMKNACKDYAVKEQELAGAGDAKTNFWYRGTLIEALLPLAWSGEPTTRAEVIDVRTAYEKLDAYDQWILRSYYEHGLTQAGIAELHTDGRKISQQGVSRAIARALGRIHTDLGGKRPFRDAPEPGWQDYVGNRHAISNAAARARTGADYGGV